MYNLAPNCAQGTAPTLSNVEPAGSTWMPTWANNFSSFSQPYESIRQPTTAPCPLPPPLPHSVNYASGIPQAPVTPISPPAVPPQTTFGQPLFVYNDVNHQSRAGIYGDQGPNANIVCGQRPLTSVRAQPMWNEHPKCAPTETKTAQNVDNYDFYQANWSVLNPYNGNVLPTVSAMWHPQNIAFIKNAIECMLTKEFGFDIGIEDTPAFRQTISDVLLDNPRWMYDVAVGLPLLNETIIKREFTVHQVAVRQQLLYEKYLIRNDRQKFMPYPISNRTVKGETINDPSSYTLNQPVPVSYECFLTQANLWCKK